jgi:hypothetical protein
MAGMKLSFNSTPFIAFGIVAIAIVGIVLSLRTPSGVTRPKPTDWRNIEIPASNFGVTAPGTFFVGEQVMDFDGIEDVVRTYLVPDRGTDYSVLAAQRPAADRRPFGEVAKDMKLTGADSAQQVGDFTAFRHDVTVGGNRTKAMVFFRERLMYQLMVTAPVKSFSEANAERYFGSFHLLAPR